ncbi:MAG: 3-phosphoshikimate 1-carboxyvinyltransferase [Ignavibacteria bacterium]|jgi:3-phosphoshikimate 1-carboxyvinyltransferase
MRFSNVKKVRGELLLPGDKSISHRALLFSALADGTSVIKNISDSDDVKTTINCLKDLNVEIIENEDSIIVKGVGREGFQAKKSTIFCGNSGTTSRLLSGILAVQNFTTSITGDESLSSRPMQRIVDPLERMGCEIESNNGKLPLKFNPPEKLKAIEYSLPVSSAQIKGAVLLTGLHSNETTTVIEDNLYTRDHTERMLNLPVEIRNNKKHSRISGKFYPLPKEYFVPGDISTAAFFIVLTLLIKNSELILRDVSLNKSRTYFIQILKEMGADITVEKIGESCNEHFGNIFIKSSQLKNVKINSELIPGIIDEIPILSVAGALSEGDFCIKGAKELRVKESDRITSLCKNLITAGLKVQEFEDGFTCSGSITDLFHNFDSFGDHRIAMTFAIMSCLSDSGGNIDGFDCISISNPDFLNQLKKITTR